MIIFRSASKNWNDAFGRFIAPGCLLDEEDKMKSPIHLLKLVCLTIIELVKQAWSLPRLAATGIRNWRREVKVDEREAERIDRIRHPEKYLGKW